MKYLNHGVAVFITWARLSASCWGRLLPAFSVALLTASSGEAMAVPSAMEARTSAKAVQ